MKQMDWVRVTALSALVACSCGKGDEGPAATQAEGGTAGNTSAAGAGSPPTSTGGASTAGSSALGGQSGASGAGTGGVNGGAQAASGGASGGVAPAAGGAQSGAGGGAEPGGSGGSAGAMSTGTGGMASGGKGGAGSASGGKGGAGSAGAANAGSGGSGGSGGVVAGCAADISRANRVLVAKAIDELFVQKDITAADRYWADPYYQHNPIAKSGVSTFRSLMSSIVSSASFSYQRLLTLAECDLAVVYGRYSQTGVIFDMFRVRDGKIMEHWDSDSNQASETSQLGMLMEDPASEENRKLFSDFSAAVLVGGATARASEFLGPSYREHHGTPATGVSALTAFLAAESVTYSKVHHVIADGNFVFALSEGKRGSAAFGFYDLFRVEGGKLVEHWDSRRSVPSSTMSGLGIF